MEKSLEQRVAELEKKVAELEGRVQAQPIEIKLDGKLIGTFTPKTHDS